MSESPCHTCDCGNYRNCKLRPPRDLTKWERRVVLVLLAVLVAGLLREVAK